MIPVQEVLRIAEKKFIAKVQARLKLSPIFRKEVLDAMLEEGYSLEDAKDAIRRATE